MEIKEPTGDECTTKAKVYETERAVGYAERKCMKYDYRKTRAGKRRFKHPFIYRLTCLIQRFLWNRGIAVHNVFSDECTPDFNCCADIGQPARIKVSRQRAKNAMEGDLQTAYNRPNTQCQKCAPEANCSGCLKFSRWCPKCTNG